MKYDFDIYGFLKDTNELKVCAVQNVEVMQVWALPFYLPCCLPLMWFITFQFRRHSNQGNSIAHA